MYTVPRDTGPRETTNHYYSNDDLLGRGATCEVYKGISKTGEYRALKIFLGRGKSSEIHNEVTALKNLQHKNVVIFYNLETDLRTSRPVVVTELCENGSLQDVLNKLEFKYGLHEDEFLIVFRHLVEGIRHLRSNGFVHRDIKPGNILRCIDDTGRSLYKLSDFGTARLLDDDDQFMSLVGTEEYLHPKLYNAAFFQRSSAGFDYKVDLWSLGATLYHCASGSVPFRPFAGRDDKQAMYAMLTKRPDGAIGGIQVEENGEIFWIKQLPPTTSLSGGLKKLITPLLAGLLENNDEKTWTFEQFFTESDKILNKISVSVLSTVQNPTWFYQIYLDPEQRLEALQAQLADQTGISPDKQILFYQNEEFQSQSSSAERDSFSDKGFPRTSLDRPIIMLCRDHINLPYTPCAYLGEVDSDKGLKFSETMNLHLDIQIANMIGGHINILYRQCMIATSLQQHTIELEHKLRKNLKRDFELTKNKRRHMKELHYEMRSIVQMVSENYKEDDIWPLSVDQQIVENDDLLEKVEEDMALVVKSFNEEHTDSETDWCFSQSLCSNKCLRLMTQASEIINRMIERRKALTKRTKGRYDGLQHSADKSKLLKLKESVLTIWKKHCLIKTRILQEKINAWFWSHTISSDKINSSIKQLEDLRLSNLQILKLLRKESREVLNQDSELMMSIDRGASVVKTNSKRASYLRQLTSDLPTIYQPDMSLDVQGTTLTLEDDQSMGTLIL